MRRLLICTGILLAPLLRAGDLTPAEIGQIETELGITLSAVEIEELGALVKPDGPLPQWRLEAEQRIAAERMADLRIEVLDRSGQPFSGAQVRLRLLSNTFNFGGVLDLRDFHDASGNLRISTTRYRELALGLFNSAGLNNGLKPKLRNGNEPLLPGFFEWAAARDLPVRGHLLIWPGNVGNNHLPADILSDVEDLEAAIASGATQQTINSLKAILKTNVDAMITEWASKWPVYEWDVINEPRGNYRVQDLLGYGEMAEWFKNAEDHAVLPGCDFFLNENQIISAKSVALDFDYYTTRRDIYKASVDRIIADGGPINGLGFQSRLKWEHLDPAIIYDRLEEFAAAYGFRMAGTEFEIISNDNAGFYPDESLRARMTEEVMTTYYSHPLVTGLNAWAYMNDGASALCDYDGSVKLNGLVWYYLHRIRYHSELEQAAGPAGSVELNGHKGTYEVIVEAGAEIKVSRVELDADMTHQVIMESPASAGMWGPYPILNDDFVDTDSWLAILYIGYLPWVWSYKLSSWLYIPEPAPAADGGWVYLPSAR